MVRAPLFDENGIKKGAWSKEEDEKLRAYILRYGHWNWRLLPQFAGLSRSGKSCRLRWVNYLKPDVKHGNFTHEEDELIIKLHERLGNRWSGIAAKIPGRTDNEIKNRWHTHIKKLYAKQLKNQSAAKLKEQSGQTNQGEIFVDAEEEFESVLPSSPNIQSHMLYQTSFSLSPETFSSRFSCSLSSSSAQVATSDAIRVPEGTTGCSGDFWTEPFITDTSTTWDTHLTSLEDCGSISSFYYYDDFLHQLMQELPRI